MDGTISFWDASCPLLMQIFMIKQQVTSNHNYFTRYFTVINVHAHFFLLHSNQEFLIKLHRMKTIHQVAPVLLHCSLICPPAFLYLGIRVER
jgi:hypothetical protein